MHVVTVMTVRSGKIVLLEEEVPMTPEISTEEDVVGAMLLEEVGSGS